MNRAEWIVGRSGYSTVMDIMGLGKKSILVPTPGQTEQEYLAGHLSKNHWAVTVEQSAFSLNAALKLAKEFRYERFQRPSGDLLEVAVVALLRRMAQTAGVQAGD